jgi:fucose 4-O-acetylase-like acetyltransferase
MKDAPAIRNGHIFFITRLFKRRCGRVLALMRERTLYLDHMRTAMTAMVVIAHAAITYGGWGSWFYVETHASTQLSKLMFTLYVATCNTSLMVMFFFLAGYFTPGSLKRKGYKAFLRDRFLRLGIPMLIFGFVVAPLTIALAERGQGGNFRNALMNSWRRHEFHTGPMWFAEGLLAFSILYCVGRWFFYGREHVEREWTEIPSPTLWIISTLVIGLVALLLRQIFPIDRRVLGVWPGNFAAYVFFFAIGIAAWKGDWLQQLSRRTAKPSMIKACLVWPVMPILVVLLAMAGQSASQLRGMEPANITVAFWEPMFGMGAVAAALLLFRKRWNQPSLRWAWLGRRAYGVYFIHPLPLVALCVVLRNVAMPAVMKFAVAGVVGCVLSWLMADCLLRIPVLKRIF